MGIQLRARLKDLTAMGVKHRDKSETRYDVDECGEEIPYTTHHREFNIESIGWVRSYHPVDLVIDNRNVNQHIRAALDILGVRYTRG
jgi:hypothetical protein